VALFPLSDGARRFFLDAAAAAARELGLHRGRLGAFASSHRARALAALLDAEDAWERAPATPIPPAGWGRLAEVIRSDRPLDAAAHGGAFHAHLVTAGRDDARALATLLAGLPEAARGLADLGGGAGVYCDAFLDAAPTAQTTLVDRAEVLAHLAPRAGRTLVVADLFDLMLPPHGIALIANVLHLYDAAACARLVQRAAAVGDAVVVKDLDPERPVARFFAVNMALYTDGGDVHAPAHIAGWLRAAGLAEVQHERIGDDVVVWARR
jgi:hypothetical protein